MTLFTAGFLTGAMLASVIVVIVMAGLTSGKISDMQGRIDELEIGR